MSVGIYVTQVTELSLKDNRCTADFWLWFRWQNDDIKPYHSFEIANGQIGIKGEPAVSKVKELNYAVVRVVATMTTFWDVSRYPFDEHDLRLWSRTATARTSSCATSPTPPAAAWTPTPECPVGTRRTPRGRGRDRSETLELWSRASPPKKSEGWAHRRITIAAVMRTYAAGNAMAASRSMFRERACRSVWNSLSDHVEWTSDRKMKANATI